MNFRLRPPAIAFWAPLFVLTIGYAIFYYYRSPAMIGDPNAQAMSNLALAVAIVIAGLIVIVATAKLWFLHLWHRRK